MKSNRAPVALLMLILALFVTSCAQAQPSTSLSLLSGSENKVIVDTILQDWARQNGVDLKVEYKGSVDIEKQLSRGAAFPYDAVWPANSLWIALGDRSCIVRKQHSIMRTPVVLGLKQKTSDRLGWSGRPVTIADIAAASESGRLSFMMTSATQSNSGASAYFSFLYSFSGRPHALTIDGLNKPQVRGEVKQILGSINRSSGSSGFLEDLFLNNYDAYDTMFNYESVVADTNR